MTGEHDQTPCSGQCINIASLQLSSSLWAVSFLVVSVSAAREGQLALVHTMHVQPSFASPDVTAHSYEHESHHRTLHACGGFNVAL